MLFSLFYATGIDMYCPHYQADHLQHTVCKIPKLISDSNATKNRKLYLPATHQLYQKQVASQETSQPHYQGNRMVEEK